MYRKIYFCFFAACLFLNMGAIQIVHAIPPEEAYDTSTDDIRILKLLPGLYYSLAVDPAIPDNFVAMSPKGQIDLYDWVYWGPKNVLEAYFKDPSSLKIPLIRVKISEEVVQERFGRFAKEQELINALPKQSREDALTARLTWGSYPVLALKYGKERAGYVAFVGLNDPESGWTLMFNLVCPKAEHPSDEDSKFWRKFVFETKQLPEPEFFKANGQDMQPGYTIMSRGGVRLKVTAEKRQKDGTIQIVVIPVSSNTTFEYRDIEECLLGSQWKYKSPLVKLYGLAIRQDTQGNEIFNEVISVLTQTVPEFSLDLETAQKRKDLFVYQIERQ